MASDDKNSASSGEVQLGFNLAKPLSGRLDGLAELAKKAARPTTRKELVAALIDAADADAKAWATRLRRYRRAPLEEAVITGQSPAWYLNPNPERRRGPRDTSAVYFVAPGSSPDDYGEPMKIRNAPSERIAIRVPAAINERLGEIVKALDDADLPTTRGEVVAALIFTASPRQDDVDKLVADYRLARLAEAKRRN